MREARQFGDADFLKAFRLSVFNASSSAMKGAPEINLRGYNGSPPASTAIAYEGEKPNCRCASASAFASASTTPAIRFTRCTSMISI